VPNREALPYLASLKFTLKHLERSYVFRSRDHPQGAYNNNNNNIFIYLFTAIGLLPGGSG